MFYEQITLGFKRFHGRTPFFNFNFSLITSLTFYLVYTIMKNSQNFLTKDIVFKLFYFS